MIIVFLGRAVAGQLDADEGGDGDSLGGCEIGAGGAIEGFPG